MMERDINRVVRHRVLLFAILHCTFLSTVAQTSLFESLRLQLSNVRASPVGPGGISATSASFADGSGGPAAASTSIELTEGSATVVSVAESEAYAEAEQVIERAVNRTFAAQRQGNETNPLIRTEAEAIGFAVAEAFARTTVQANLTGTGRACGAASAEANATATALVEAFSNAVLLDENAGPDANISALAAATVSVTVRAFAEAQSAACTDGGFVQAEQESFSAALADIFASSLALVINATTVVEEVTTDVMRDAFAESMSAVNATGNSTGDTDGFAGAGVAENPVGAPEQDANNTLSEAPSPMPATPDTVQAGAATAAQANGQPAPPTTPSPSPTPVTTPTQVPPPSPPPSPPPPPPPSPPSPSPVPPPPPVPAAAPSRQSGLRNFFFREDLPEDDASGFSFRFNEGPFFGLGRKLLVT